MSEHTISNIQFRPASHRLPENLVGWVACILDGDVRLNNLKILKNEEGRMELHYPQSQSRKGSKFFSYHPTNPSFHKFLEDSIFTALNENLKHFSNDNRR